MSKQVSITLDGAILNKQLEDAYTDQANDPEFQAEISLWDVTVGDGLMPNPNPH